ncbi:MAG: integrin alpha [Planctomycetota bacterium]|nr:integrin alpha [Planctomycetota bacterium]
MDRKRVIGSFVLGLVASTAAFAQAPGDVLAELKISDEAGGLGATLDDFGRFGSAVAAIGDLDGDGNPDLVVGAHRDPGGGPPGAERGAVWVLFLHADGTVKAEQKISDTHGGFTGGLDDGDLFGSAIGALGDFDGDGVVDVVVGAPEDDDGGPPGSDRGALWLLFLNTDGTVKAHKKISDTAGGFSGALGDEERFGISVAPLGDFDGDGVGDLATGALFDDDGGPKQGAVWLLFLNADGTVKAHKKISATQGGFGGDLDGNDRFGRSVSCLGDLDGDGVDDLAVGAVLDDDGGPPGSNRGAVWVLFLNADGTVKAETKISSTSGGFSGDLDDHDLFGLASAAPGDLDGDGTRDLVVGAPRDDDGGPDRGAAWVLFLRSDGTVRGHVKIAAGSGGFVGPLSDGDELGTALAVVDGLALGGKLALANGAHLDDDGGPDRGAIWIQALDGLEPAAVTFYGCGVNPPGSLTVLAGVPSIGTTITLGVDNPLGTQAAGSLPFLGLAFQPDPAFPCGTLVPGFGMAGPGASGEQLIPSGPPLLFTGPPWSGPGSPAPFDLAVPDDPGLLGVSVYAQGLLFDPTAAFGVIFGLTEAAELLVGP